MYASLQDSGGKIRFLCFADKIEFVFAFLVFYLLSVYLCGLFLYRRNPSGQSLHRKSRSWAKSPKGGDFRAVFGWTEYRADVMRMRLNRGVSRGDRGGVRGCCGVGFAYNFLLESKTYILIFWAFPV